MTGNAITTVPDGSATSTASTSASTVATPARTPTPDRVPLPAPAQYTPRPGKPDAELCGCAVGALKLNVYLVAYRDSRELECRTAYPNAEAAPADEHRAPGKGDPVELAGHSHLPASAQLGDQVSGNVDDSQAARLILPPAANTSAKRSHDPLHRAPRTRYRQHRTPRQPAPTGSSVVAQVTPGYSGPCSRRPKRSARAGNSAGRGDDRYGNCVVGGRGREAFPSVDPARTATATSKASSSSARPFPPP